MINFARVFLALQEGVLPEFSEEIMLSENPHITLLRSAAFRCWNEVPHFRPNMESILQQFESSVLAFPHGNTGSASSSFTVSGSVGSSSSSFEFPRGFDNPSDQGRPQILSPDDVHEIVRLQTEWALAEREKANHSRE